MLPFFFTERTPFFERVGKRMEYYTERIFDDSILLEYRECDEKKKREREDFNIIVVTL